MKEKEVNLFYRVNNQGDGSVSVIFHKDEKSADKEEKNQDEGWGESSVSNVKLKIIDEEIYFYKTYYDENDKYCKCWIKLG